MNFMRHGIQTDVDAVNATLREKSAWPSLTQIYNDVRSDLSSLGRTYEDAARGAALGGVIGGRLGGTRGAGIGGLLGTVGGAYFGLSAEQSKQIHANTTQFAQGYHAVAQQSNHHIDQAKSWFETLGLTPDTSHNSVHLLTKEAAPVAMSEDPTR
jgi:hypothetical protein